MKKYILLLIIALLAGCSNNNDEKAKAENEVEYTKENYLVKTANDIREIRTAHDELIEYLVDEEEPVKVSITLMDISIAASDQSYKLPGTESMEFDLIKKDLQGVQSFVDEKYKVFSEQKELDKLALNETITKLSTLIEKLETDFESIK